jgi:hypothetical protein
MPYRCWPQPSHRSAGLVMPCHPSCPAGGAGRRLAQMSPDSTARRSSSLSRDGRPKRSAKASAGTMSSAPARRCSSRTAAIWRRSKNAQATPPFGSHPTGTGTSSRELGRSSPTGSTRRTGAPRRRVGPTCGRAPVAPLQAPLGSLLYTGRPDGQRDGPLPCMRQAAHAGRDVLSPLRRPHRARPRRRRGHDRAGRR